MNTAFPRNHSEKGEIRRSAELPGNLNDEYETYRHTTQNSESKGKSNAFSLTAHQNIRTKGNTEKK